MAALSRENKNKKRANSREQLILVAALILRSAILGFVIFVADDLAGLGSSPAAASAFAALGVFLAPIFASTRLSTLGMATLTGGGAAVYLATGSALTYVGAAMGGEPLKAYSIAQHLDVFAAAFAASLFTTFLFLRHESTGSVEALLIALGGVAILAGHRNFHFEMPRAVNDFAWSLGIGNLPALIVLAGGLLVAMLLYLILAALAWSKFRAGPERVFAESPARLRRGALLSALTAAAVIFFLVGSAVQRRYAQEAFSRTANGVGQSSTEGKSPLGFHSALGGTNQPAALVRLEGDYRENPASPMLYLREAALSEMSENEIVRADPKYDQDVSWTRPTDPFSGEADVELEERVPVNQSVYTLADQDNAFAIDYPLSIVQLKNPNPKRFKSSYRAYSMAPAFKTNDLGGLEVGDPRWSEETRRHYLTPNKDPRYAELAKKIAGDLQPPILKAKAITDYLTNTAIYTLTPNHDVKPNEDPVAPFLFGDHRGYCVHFAHATVYMLRSLGIPSRIGTGYLTDLSQSKDGHILLRMADRHAWAEVYVKNRGWVPFDIQPKQVESHGDLQVDMKLLEELMGMVDPGEEILPSETIKDEKNVRPTEAWRGPDGKTIAAILAGLLMLALAIKLYLRFGWLAARHPAARLRGSYVATASKLHDLGIRRELGETRLEFSKRASGLGLSTGAISEMFISSAYSKRNALPPIGEIDAARRAAAKSTQNTHWLRRISSWLNPSSAISFLRGGKW